MSDLSCSCAEVVEDLLIIGTIVIIFLLIICVTQKCRQKPEEPEPKDPVC